jgi:hypothetical protein
MSAVTIDGAAAPGGVSSTSESNFSGGTQPVFGIEPPQ